LAVILPCFSQRRKVSDEIPSFLVALCADKYMEERVYEYDFK